MVNKAVKAVVIIACLSTGILAVLLAPLLNIENSGSNLVQFSESVDQINLITNSNVGDVEIRYTTNASAPLISMSYHYLIRHAVIFSPDVIVSFNNLTVGKILTVQLTMDITELGFTSIVSSIISLTINPKLLSNLSIHVGTGNILLDNTHSLNQTFLNVDLRAATGNINVNLTAFSHIMGEVYLSSATGSLGIVTGMLVFADGSLQATCSTGSIDVNLGTANTISGDLHLYAITGNSDLEIGENSSIYGSMQVKASSGNVAVLLKSGTLLQTDFLLQTVSGNVDLTYTDLFLEDINITGTVQATSGNILVNIQQLRNLNGNMTLNVNTGSGNINFHISLEFDNLSSRIYSHYGSGATYYFPPDPLGFASPSGGYLYSDIPNRASRIDANLLTTSGNIYIYASRT